MLAQVVRSGATPKQAGASAAALGPAAHPSPSPRSSGDDTLLPRFEEVFDEAGAVLGQRPSISKLKDLLRANGRNELASRRSRMSKARNSMAHPDTALSTSVVEALICFSGGP